MKHLYSIVVVIGSCFVLSACGSKGGLMQNLQNKGSNDEFSQRMPLKLHAKAVLLYRDDGSGNFDLNNREQNTLFLDFLEQNNLIYSNFQRPANLENCYNGTDFIPDAKIRFEFDIVQVRNTYYWNYLNSGADMKVKNFNNLTPHGNWYMKPLDDSLHLKTKQAPAINIYFTSDGSIHDEMQMTKGESHKNTMGGQAAAQLPDRRNMHRSSMVHFPNRYLKYLVHRHQSPKDFNTTWDETRNWNLNDAKGLAHELGHTLGLAHINEHHRANQCSYSLMSQAGSHARNWLPPTEIKKIHENLSHTNLMQFVDKDSWYGTTAQINTDSHWNTKRRYYSSFDVQEGVKLQISDTVILPVQSRLNLRKNAQLEIIKPGALIDSYGNTYKNIEQHSSARIIR
ncbi:MAG: hypothetical protein Q4F57_10305 [Weeksellaceae bacterium]|nr:hypothetical protein [Weeksellaceae bacterium]